MIKALILILLAVVLLPVSGLSEGKYAMTT